MAVNTLQWKGSIEGSLELLDQRKLPNEETYISCKEIGQVYDAIKTLAVRGAPAIGVTAAYGLVLPFQKLDENCDIALAEKELQKSIDCLSKSRPTAVNLFWAMKRIRKAAETFVKENPAASKDDLAKRILDEANEINNEDIRMCKKIGENGQEFIEKNASILTHCNAGALATAGQGTALSVIYEAQFLDKKPTVYVDETRPLLQGARLTAWELVKEWINTNVICDSAAGSLIKLGKIDCIITGADRIAGNGDTANKIGTYTLSVLARENGIPFYIAAPSSTFDMNIESGDEIPIEERDPQEIKNFSGTQTAPENAKAYNPAFDITPAENITAIITEKGNIISPDKKTIEALINS